MNKILPNLNPKIPKVKIITKRSEQKLEDSFNEKYYIHNNLKIKVSDYTINELIKILA